MEVAGLKIARANIVLIFDSLLDEWISRDQLRRALPDRKPESIEVPEFVAVKYVDINAEASIMLAGQNRLEAKMDDPTTETLALVPLLAINARQAITSAKLKAFGFNFLGFSAINPLMGALFS